MGFEAPETLYKLTWEDPAMAGLEVTVREPSIDGMMSMTALDIPDAKKATVAQLRSVFETFATLLDSWNVERKGVPVPATYEGIVSLAPAFAMEIIEAVGRGFTRADPTSSSASPPGGSSGLENSIPMTPLPPNPEGS